MWCLLAWLGARRGGGGYEYLRYTAANELAISRRIFSTHTLTLLSRSRGSRTCARLSRRLVSAAVNQPSFLAPLSFCFLCQLSPSSPTHSPSLLCSKQRNKTIGAAHSPKAAKAVAAAAEKKKKASAQQPRPADACRDPITLDDLGSWTWDFRACEAATPPVSCGGTAELRTKHGGGGKGKGGGKGGRRGGRGGCGGSGSSFGNGSSGSNSSSAVVTYNVESLVLYLLESGDFQVRASVFSRVLLSG